MAELEAQLASGDGRLARYVLRLGTAIRLLAALVVAAGGLALLLGLAAWHDSPVGVTLVVLACLPALVTPLFVAHRTSALADAAAHPRELTDQARDLVGRVRTSPELASLARTVRSRRQRTTPSRGRGRAAGALGLLRRISRVVGLVDPDPVRHRLLIPLRPERLRATWLGVIVSLWAWALAASVAVVALLTLGLRLAGW